MKGKGNYNMKMKVQSGWCFKAAMCCYMSLVDLTCFFNAERKLKTFYQSDWNDFKLFPFSFFPSHLTFLSVQSFRILYLEIKCESTNFCNFMYLHISIYTHTFTYRSTLYIDQHFIFVLHTRTFILKKKMWL